MQIKYEQQQQAKLFCLKIYEICWRTLSEEDVSFMKVKLKFLHLLFLLYLMMFDLGQKSKKLA